MNLQVRDADLDADRDLLIQFLREHLTENSDGRRFDWLYRNNPAGPARAWLAEGEGEIVGVAAAIPRAACLGGEDVVGWNLADFVVGPAHRSLGPALQLQRACLGPVTSGEVAFCYDFPSRSMMAIYRRLGLVQIGSEVRYARPLRVDRKLAEKVRVKPLAKGLSLLANPLLAVRDLLMIRRPAGIDVALHRGGFDASFTDLDNSLRPAHAVHLRRTAEYLNWRYHDHPFQDYEVLTARVGGRLVGFLIFYQDDRNALITELVTDGPSNATRGLFRELFKILRKRGIFTLSLPVVDTSDMVSFLGEFGFYPREDSPVVVHTRPDGKYADLVSENMQWYLTFGDRLG